MAMPPYISDLRAKIGNDLLWLPGATAIVIDGTTEKPTVLLVCRSDNGEWTPVTGFCDPGEDPDVTAVREVYEETTVRITVDRLIWIQALPASEYVNGDKVQYFDVAFVCSRTSGDPRVGDDESSEARWWPVDSLPPMNHRFTKMIQIAVNKHPGIHMGSEGRIIA